MDPQTPRNPQDPQTNNPQPTDQPPQPTPSGEQRDPVQSEYRPTAPGGYSSHDQPTQAYGPGPGPGPGLGQDYGQQPGQGAYGGYQPQQSYNVNTPKKGTPAWVWGAIGAVVIALVGGSVLLFVLLAPKSNSPSGVTTPQPTSAAGQPTNALNLPTVVSGSTPATTPARTAQEPTAVTSRATSVPVQGQGGFAGAPRDAANAFFNSLQSGNYVAARLLLAPELQAETDVSQLETVWQTVQSGISGIDVGDATESGNTATVAVTFHVALVDTTEAIAVGLRKDGGRWYITDPLGGVTGPN